MSIHWLMGSSSAALSLIVPKLFLKPYDMGVWSIIKTESSFVQYAINKTVSQYS